MSKVLMSVLFGLAVLSLAACSSHNQRSRGDRPGGGGSGAVATTCDGNCGRSECDAHRSRCAECRAGRPCGGNPGQGRPSGECGGFTAVLGDTTSDWSQPVLLKGRTRVRVTVDGKTEIVGIEPLPCEVLKPDGQKQDPEQK